MKDTERGHPAQDGALDARSARDGALDARSARDGALDARRARDGALDARRARDGRRPVVGIVTNAVRIGDVYDAQAGSWRTIDAVVQGAGCDAVLIPSMPQAGPTATWLALLDGVVLPGARANVHPEEYGERDDGRHGPFDRARDGVALPLIRAMIAAAKPVFGVCRGIQEMNVAFGGTLHPEVRDAPGRDNHRMPPEERDPRVIFRPRHAIDIAPGGALAAIVGPAVGPGPVVTNSLHGQAVWRAGEGVAIEAVAPDGTVEAISIHGAQSFAIGVQWHAEYEPTADPVHRALWGAFGDAARIAAAARAGVLAR